MGFSDALDEPAESEGASHADITLASPWPQPGSQLIDRLRPAEQVVPLVGAGVSVSAGLPLGRELATWLRQQRFARGIDFARHGAHAQANALMVSTVIVRERPELADDLQQALRDHIEQLSLVAPRTPVIDALARAPGGLVLTLNYDDLIEQAAQALGRPFERFTLDSFDPRELMQVDGVLRVMHLHGSVRLPSSLVLDQRTYAKREADADVGRLMDVLHSHNRSLCILGTSFGEDYLALLLKARAESTPRNVIVCKRTDAEAIRQNRPEAKLTTLMHGVAACAYPDGEDVVIEAFCQRLLEAPEPPPSVDIRPEPGLLDDPRYVSRTLVALDTPSEQDLTEASWWSRGVVDEKALRTASRAVVIGAPGSGKSKLLAELCRAPASGEVTALIALRRLPEPLGSAAGLLRSWLHGAVVGPAGLDVEAIMGGRQRVHLLLDALDETPPDRRRALLDAVQEVAENHPMVRVTLTSRPLKALAELSPSWRRLELLCDVAWLERMLDARADWDPGARQRLQQLPHAIQPLLQVPFYARRLVELEPDRLQSAANADGPLGLVLWLLAEQIGEDDRLLALDGAVMRWLGDVALTMQLTGQRRLELSQLSSLTTGLQLGPVDALVELLEQRALLELQGEQVVFGHRLFADALVAQRMRAGTPDEWLDIVLPQWDERRVLRDDWQASVQLLMQVDPGWRAAIAVHDPPAAARAIPPGASRGERADGALALWANACARQVWLDGAFSRERSDARAIADLAQPGDLDDFLDDLEAQLVEPATRYERANALDVLLLARPRRGVELICGVLTVEPDSTVRRSAASWARKLELAEVRDAVAARARQPEDDAEASDMASVALRLTAPEDRMTLGLALLHVPDSDVHDHHVLDGVRGLPAFRWYSERIRAQRQADPDGYVMPARRVDENLAELGDITPAQQAEVGAALALAQARGSAVQQWLEAHPAAARGFAACLATEEVRFYDVMHGLLCFEPAVLQRYGVTARAVRWVRDVHHARANPQPDEPTSEELELPEDDAPAHDLRWLLSLEDPERMGLLANQRVVRTREAASAPPDVRDRLREVLDELWGQRDLREAMRATGSGHSVSHWAAVILFYAPVVAFRLSDERWVQTSLTGWRATTVTDWLRGQLTPERLVRAAEEVPGDPQHLAALIAVAGRLLHPRLLQRFEEIDPGSPADGSARAIVERLTSAGQLDALAGLWRRVPAWRPLLDPVLAAHADVDAQARQLAKLEQRTSEGELMDPDEIGWMAAVEDGRFVANLERLVRSAHDVEQDAPRRVTQAALDALERIGGRPAFEALDRIVSEPAWDGAQWHADKRDAVAQRAASEAALGPSRRMLEALRLPGD